MVLVNSRRIAIIGLIVVGIVGVLFAILPFISEHGFVGFSSFTFEKKEWAPYFELLLLLGKMIIYYSCILLIIWGILLLASKMDELRFRKNEQAADSAVVEIPKSTEPVQPNHSYNTRSKSRYSKMQ